MGFNKLEILNKCLYMLRLNLDKKKKTLIFKINMLIQTLYGNVNPICIFGTPYQVKRGNCHGLEGSQRIKNTTKIVIL